MNIRLIKNILISLLIILTQVIVLNQIHLFACATPLLYVYIIIMFRRNFPRWAILVWSFLTGLIVDVFTNTPGVAAASMTFMGMVQPAVLRLFINRDTPDDLLPTGRTLGFGHYASYTTILVTLYCLIFFTLETFTFFNWLQWIECVVGSSAITIVLILALENFRKN